MSNKYDVIVIGAGAVGCAVARELSRYALKVAVLEKECDVAAGTSGRNSAVVHAGFNNKPGSLMAQLCVEGNRGFAALCRALERAYVCRSADCLRRAVKSRALSRALEAQIPDEVMERLAAAMEADDDGQGS